MAGRRRKDPVAGICCYPLADPLEHLRRPDGDASAWGNYLELFAAICSRHFDAGNWRCSWSRSWSWNWSRSWDWGLGYDQHPLTQSHLGRPSFLKQWADTRAFQRQRIRRGPHNGWYNGMALRQVGTPSDAQCHGGGTRPKHPWIPSCQAVASCWELHVHGMQQNSSAVPCPWY